MQTNETFPFPKRNELTLRFKVKSVQNVVESDINYAPAGLKLSVAMIHDHVRTVGKSFQKLQNNM